MNKCYVALVGDMYQDEPRIIGVYTTIQKAKDAICMDQYTYYGDDNMVKHIQKTLTAAVTTVVLGDIIFQVRSYELDK